jgi:hypothetical protein
MRNITKFSLVILSAIFLSACTTPAPSNTNTQAGEDKTTPTEQSQTSSLRELLAAGKSQKCVFTSSRTDDNKVTINTSGTIYISGKKMLEEIQVKSNDKEALNIDTRLISDGTTIYTWDANRKNSGIKFKIAEQAAVAGTKTQNQSVDLDNKVDMKCSAWALDETKFNVPTDIQFTDLSEMMKNIPTVPANLPTGK